MFKLTANLYELDKYGRRLRYYDPRTKESAERPILTEGALLQKLSEADGVARCMQVIIDKGVAREGGKAYNIPVAMIEEITEAPKKEIDKTE